MLKHLIDLSFDQKMTKFGYETVMDRYLQKGETSPQHAFLRAATAFASNPEHAERMFNYIRNQWYGCSSPSLSNAPTRTKWGDNHENNMSADCFESVAGPLPISCFTGYVPDSRVGLADHYQEILWFLSNGGGYQASWSAIRPMDATTSTGNKTGGMVSFYHATDALTPATHQGSNRRGVYGGEVRCDHVEVEEFALSRKMSGDTNRRSRNVFQTISITDAFMEAVLADSSWDLVDHLGLVQKTVQARYLWELFLDAAAETGCPFLHFIDTSNRYLPEVQKKLGLKVNNVNICTEITLANNVERTAVCCLGSVNFFTYDQWKGNKQFIADCIEYLDNILEYFIQNAIFACTKDLDWQGILTTIHNNTNLSTAKAETLLKDLVQSHIMGYKKAVFSAKSERAVGLGGMGLGSYFLDHDIYYDSREAIETTDRIYAFIKESATEASRNLGITRGEPSDMRGTGLRNSHLLAIAPTATNSTISATSISKYSNVGGLTPALEARYEMTYAQKTKSGRFEVVEQKLLTVLDEYGQNTEHVLQSIRDNKGSVQHLTFLSDHHKRLLKTAREIDQRWIVEVAAAAQQYVCQAISLNLDFEQGAPRKYVNAVHFHMWKKGLKSRYYIRMPAIKTANVFAKNHEQVQTINYDAEDMFSGCLGCQ